MLEEVSICNSTKSDLEREFCAIALAIPFWPALRSLEVVFMEPKFVSAKGFSSFLEVLNEC